MHHGHLDRSVPSVTCLALLLAATTSLAGGSETQGETNACLAGKLERAAFSARAYDEATGLDLRTFPPDRVVDYEHMKLEMRFDDLDRKQFSATETLRFTPIGRPAEAVTLDAVGLRIESVTLNDSTVEHYCDDDKLTLRFDPPLPPGRPAEVVIAYSCLEPYDGMFFTPSSPDAPHYTAEVHTQGQTVTNRHWFACHDFPNERMTTELIVDVPAGFSVSSNGRLVGSLQDGDRVIWHYLQDTPHVSYLVSLVIGKFDIVRIPHPRVPLQVWVPQGLGDQVMQTYGRTAAMIDLFERRFGVPYPWDRYDQLVVKNFGPGGMENTSATTMYPTAIFDATALADRDLDGLIAHELAHQWMGDYITCKDWSHIWLNEGGATYGSALWFEHRDGEDGYLDSMRRSLRGLARRDKTTNDLPMVSPVYEHAWENFRRAANPYSKGSFVLHMLRAMLGDQIFFQGMQMFLERHGLGTVETADLRYVMEEVSGLGLEWFFQQWCYRPGVPKLAVEIRYDGRTRTLEADVVQTQDINERTPAFRFDLPVFVRTAGGDEMFEIDVREKTASFQTTLDGPPHIVAVDPWLHVLQAADVDKPQSMWMEQAINGPTIAARHAAIEALADVDTPETIHLLSTLITDESVRYTLRNTAVDTLSKYGSAQARRTLLAAGRAGVAEARVRARLVGALDDLEAGTVTDLLADIAGSDPSYATRVAAIRGLAALEACEHADLIVELVEFPSQHDDVRRAALTALAKLDDPRGLDLAMRYATYGYMDRARPAAIAAIGTLAHHDPDLAVPYLIALLDDHERRTVAAAGAALAQTGDERAVAPIRAMSVSHPQPRMRDRAEGWLETLEKKQTGREG